MENEESYLAAALSSQEEEKKPSSKTNTVKKQSKGQMHTKDLQLSIFHALGKFLYNKRIHPKTKKVEQLPYKMMENADKRP